MRFLAGIDETATETALSEGWTYFILPKESVTDFEIAAGKLLTPRLKAFHGKKFKQEFRKEYTTFLKLTRQYVQKTPAMLAVTLNNEAWKRQYLPFCYRMLEEVFQYLGIKNRDLVDTTKKFIPPLFNLQSLLNIFNLYYQIEILIDSDDVTKRLGTFVTDINSNLFAIKNIKAEYPLQKFYNSYRQLRFPKSPELIYDGIQVLKDSKSKVIQAADVVGNFSTAYIFVRLGKKSRSKETKAEIFEEVFGDFFAQIKFDKQVELIGEDLKLKSDGALQLIISSFPE